MKKFSLALKIKFETVKKWLAILKITFLLKNRPHREKLIFNENSTMVNFFEKKVKTNLVDA